MIILAIISCSTNENNMTISGNVDGLMKGTLYLQYEKDSAIVNLDSIYLKGKSEYKLKTNITEPDLYYLYLDKEDGDTLNDIIMFFGENGEIEINSRLSNFDSSYEIIGSKNSDLLIEYNSIMRQYNFQNLDLLQIFYQAQILSLIHI